MGDSEMKDLLDMGVLFAGSGQAAMARAYFTKAVKIDPDSAFAWYYLGAVLDDPEKKQYCFSRAAILDPDIHQKIIQANTQRTPEYPETEMAEGQVVEEPAINEVEDTPTDREIEIEPDPVPEPEPEIIEKNAPPKRKRLSPFMIILLALLLVLILLAGAAYWMIVLR